MKYDKLDLIPIGKITKRDPNKENFRPQIISFYNPET